MLLSCCGLSNTPISIVMGWVKSISKDGASMASKAFIIASSDTWMEVSFDSSSLLSWDIESSEIKIGLLTKRLRLRE